MSSRYRGWGGALPKAKPGAPKYGNERTEYKGAMYDSKREAEYAQELDVRERAGEVRNIRRQVRIDLRAASCLGESCSPSPVTFQPSGKVAFHVLDFVFEEGRLCEDYPCTMSEGIHNHWYIRYVEVKGYDTPVGKLKRAIVEAMLGVEIEVVK